jgi:aldehyde reductase
MVAKIPTLKLNNGKEMPILGLGTWKSKPGEVVQAVKDAIDAGYRHIDCAHVYQNEDEVGEGINAKIQDGTVKREDLFIVSKLWNTMHRPDLVRPALETTLKHLKLKYLDLYLIHWPMGYKEDGPLFPTDANGKVQYSDVDYLDTWKSMEQLVEAGLTKSIGISNFNSKQLERLLASCKIKPVTNQVECHPYLNQNKLAAHHTKLGVVLTAYSPLGSPDRPWAKPDDPKLLDDPRLKGIADKYKKETAQILIRYQLDKGNIVIPKSVTKSRIISNAEVFDFQLTKDEIALIDSFDCNAHFVPLTDQRDHKYHPFATAEF